MQSTGLYAEEGLATRKVNAEEKLRRLVDKCKYGTRRACVEQSRGRGVILLDYGPVVLF